MDKARDAFDSAIHKTKVLLHAEEPTVAEKVNAALAEARTRADALANSLSSSLPSSGEMTDAARSQYYQTLAAARSQFEAIKHDTDKALKAAGLRERSSAEKLTDSFHSAWHDLGTSLGLSEPTLLDRASSELRAESGTSMDSLLKTLHLRSRSSLEQARDGYLAALHGLKAAVGAEEPTVAERVNSVVEEVQLRVKDAVSAALPHLPPAGVPMPAGGPATAEQMSEAARAVYEDTSQRAIEGLLHARAEADALLKNAGKLKDAAAVKVGGDARKGERCGWRVDVQRVAHSLSALLCPRRPVAGRARRTGFLHVVAVVRAGLRGAVARVAADARP
jgi:hypothetical protein